jgi:hypothetical protein
MKFKSGDLLDFKHLPGDAVYLVLRVDHRENKVYLHNLRVDAKGWCPAADFVKVPST